MIRQGTMARGSLIGKEKENTQKDVSVEYGSNESKIIEYDTNA